MREYLRAALQPAQLGIAFLSIASGVTVLQLRPWLIGTAQKAEVTVDYAGRAAHHIDETAGVAEDAASRERDFFKDTLPVMAGDIRGILRDTRLSLSHADELLGSLRQTSDGLNDSQHRIADATVGAINGLQPTEKEIADTIPYIRKSVTDLDALAQNSDIPKTIHNVQSITSNVDGTAKDVQETTKDVKDAVHSYLHPTLPKRIWGWIEGTGLDVAKFFIP